MVNTQDSIQCWWYPCPQTIWKVLKHCYSHLPKDISSPKSHLSKCSVIIFWNTTFVQRNHSFSSRRSYLRGTRAGSTTPMPGAGAPKMLHAPLSSLSLLWFSEWGKGVFCVGGKVKRQNRGPACLLPESCTEPAAQSQRNQKQIHNQHGLLLPKQRTNWEAD